MQSKMTIIGQTERNTVCFEGKRPIFELLAEAELGDRPHFPCGGKKTCGKCKIQIVSGAENVSAPDETEKKFLSQLSGDANQNIRYACMCEAFGDIEISLDVGHAAGKMEIQTEGQTLKDISPDNFRIVRAKLAVPTLERPISDEDNLLCALKEATGQSYDRPGFRLIQKLSAISDIQGQELDVVLCGSRILDARAAGEVGDIYGLAFDIGTTTVAAYLHSLTSGELVASAAAENPQRIHGADVISRIDYTIEQPDGLSELNGLILSLVFDLSAKLCEQGNINPGDIYGLVLTGNTVMQHILAGLPPKNIAFTPFVAATLFGFETTLAELAAETAANTTINPAALIYFPPAFASYVGGDIATGIIASGTDLCPWQRLFLDVGTNGEIGLGNKDKLVFCGTAAGPAFEGAHIALGMAGVPGAVCNICLDEQEEIICKTIGDIEPIGICGSGVIDAVALMCELGVVDETGRILESDEIDEIPEKYRKFAAGLCEIGGENAFLIDARHNIYMTQKDIREIQLAKAAISAGILTLLEHCGVSLADVGELVLAGGFGFHIDKKSACRIGLIPKELEDRIIVAGNTAGMGAAAVLLDRSAKERIAKLASKAEYIELSGDASFMEKYVEQMMF